MKKLAIASLAALMVPAMSYADISVNHLGSTNTLVRPDCSGRYLILPVQESMPDARVDILVDGLVKNTIYVRLADSSVDYTVPLDLAPYCAEGAVLLSIEVESSRAHSREVSDYVCWEEMTQADSFPTENTEKYRPLYHHTPLYGWMNDPNGMFYRDGRWHLYYQANPYGSKWQNMSWGHSSSADLHHWDHHPIAIEPDGLGAVFSGSAVVMPGDTVAALFTSAGRCQVQSLAYSTDGGNTFTRYQANPVLPNPREARDPKVMWHEPSGQWVMVLADALEQQVQFYTSPDLKQWTLQSSFGKGYGSQFGVWECPDLFELPVEGTSQTRWVLLCNINPGGPFGGSATQYFVGDFDGKRFTCSSPASVSKWMDYGKDHYAAVTWSNAPADRRTAIAWMSNWQYANEVPTMQFRSANTLPRDLGLYRASDGEIYLRVLPTPEVEALRHSPAIYKPAADETVFSLPSDCCEIVVDYSAKGTPITFELKNDLDEKVLLTIDPEMQQATLDRTHSGLTKFSRHFPAVTIAPTHSTKKSGQLRIFIDRCSIEVFDGSGRWVMTDLVFPTEPYSALSVSTSPKTKINQVSIYSLEL